MSEFITLTYTSRKLNELKQDKCKETHNQTHPSKNVESQRQGENLKGRKRNMTFYMQRNSNKVNN